MAKAMLNSSNNNSNNKNKAEGIAISDFKICYKTVITQCNTSTRINMLINGTNERSQKLACAFATKL